MHEPPPEARDLTGGCHIPPPKIGAFTYSLIQFAPSKVDISCRRVEILSCSETADKLMRKCCHRT